MNKTKERNKIKSKLLKNKQQRDARNMNRAYQRMLAKNYAEELKLRAMESNL